MQSFMPTRFFVFKIQAIKNGFAGPKRFRGFRETGPRYEILSVFTAVSFSKVTMHLLKDESLEHAQVSVWGLKVHPFHFAVPPPGVFPFE